MYASFCLDVRYDDQSPFNNSDYAMNPMRCNICEVTRCQFRHTHNEQEPAMTAIRAHVLTAASPVLSQ